MNIKVENRWSWSSYLKTTEVKISKGQKAKLVVRTQTQDHCSNISIKILSHPVLKLEMLENTFEIHIAYAKMQLSDCKSGHSSVSISRYK